MSRVNIESVSCVHIINIRCLTMTGPEAGGEEHHGHTRGVCRNGRKSDWPAGFLERQAFVPERLACLFGRSCHAFGVSASSAGLRQVIHMIGVVLFSSIQFRSLMMSV